MIFRIVLLVILVAFRFYDIDVRPPHHDEAVNGWFVDGIVNRGYYQYDPQNYHGPLFFYFLTFFERLFGRSITSLRIDPLIFGALVTATPVLFRKWIGERGMWVAMFFLAVSPAMVFYSRYAIHEMMFAFACIFYFYYWLRLRSEAFDWTIVAGLGISLGAMACLKENFVIYVGSLIIAEIGTQVLDFGFSIGKVLGHLKSKLASRNFWIGFGTVVGIAIVMIFLCYSALGRDENGFSNFFQAFVFWTDTGSKGNGHQKPFFYWVYLMTQYEWMAMLGLVLTPFALMKVPSQVRLISILSFGLFLAYSIVNYKTPWCLLSFYWGLILVAAFWINTWMKTQGKRYALTVVLIVLFCLSGYQAYDAAYAEPDQEGHPYIYGQTFRDFMGPLNQLLDEARANPSLLQTRKMMVVSAFTWPLPYILGEYRLVGYYGEQNAPAVLEGDVIMIDESLDAKFQSRIRDIKSFNRTVVRSRQWASPMVFYRK